MARKMQMKIRVKIFKYEHAKHPETGKNYQKKVADGEGSFREWGVDFEYGDMSTLTYTVAIVERDNGEVVPLPLSLIQFQKQEGE